jgi:hypothetical protein
MSGIITQMMVVNVLSDAVGMVVDGEGHNAGFDIPAPEPGINTRI